MREPSSQRRARLALVLGVAVALTVAWRLGAFEQFANPARLRDNLVAMGGYGYLLFIVSYMFLQPFGVPGTVFILAAPLIWPWPVAFLLSMTGTMAASVVGFSFARFVARDWIARRIPERFRRYDEALEKKAFTTVFVLRFVFWMPPLLHAFFGVSKVRFSTHFWGSLLGYIVPLLAVSYFGEKLFELLRSSPGTVYGTVAAALAILVGVMLWRRRRRRANTEAARS